MGEKPIPPSTLRRLPVYLSYLKTLSLYQSLNISATAIASALDLGEVQVRKDLAMVCDTGKPKVGYFIPDLIKSLETSLGFNRMDEAVIVGAGKLGKALLDYDGFSECGLHIAAAFDIDPSVTGVSANGNRIYPISTLKTFCSDNEIKIGIITVPASCAQSVCDLMADSGITAVMNFAPVHLKAQPSVTIKNENIAASLALLSRSIKA